MSDYTKTTNFTAKDALLSGDTNKIVRGSEIDDEFTAIETAVGTKVNTDGNSTVTGDIDITGEVTITNSGVSASHPPLNLYCSGTGGTNLVIGLGNTQNGILITRVPTAAFSGKPFAYSSDFPNGTWTFVDANGELLVGGTYASTPNAKLDVRGNAIVTGNATLGDTVATDTHTINGATTLSADSASAALTINQIGAGNALVVEDSASPDSTPFIVDANGRIVQGATSQSYNFSHEQYADSSAGTNYQSGVLAYQAGASTYPRFVGIRAKGTIASKTAVTASGDALATFEGYGYDGSTIIQGARIDFVVDGTPGPSDMPTRIVFNTTADGGISPTERMRINSLGNIAVGTSTATYARLQLYRAQSDTANTEYGILNDCPVTASSGSATKIGTYGSIYSTTGFANTGSLVGSAGYCSHTVTGTMSYAVGHQGYISNAGAGTISSGVAFRAASSANSGGGTITYNYGFQSLSQTVGNANYQFICEDSAAVGAGKTTYGFYGNNAIATGGGTTWNFFAGGTAPNGFSGDVKIFGAGGLGYATGSGGAVTQTTSRTTSVTLNKTNGAITLVSAAGSTSWQSFTVTNSTVAATDTIILSQKSGTDKYRCHVTAVGAGSFEITFATTGGTTTEQPVINFSVIKAVAA